MTPSSSWKEGIRGYNRKRGPDLPTNPITVPRVVLMKIQTVIPNTRRLLEPVVLGERLESERHTDWEQLTSSQHQQQQQESVRRSIGLRNVKREVSLFTHTISSLHTRFPACFVHPIHGSGRILWAGHQDERTQIILLVYFVFDRESGSQREESLLLRVFFGS